MQSLIDTLRHKCRQLSRAVALGEDDLVEKLDGEIQPMIRQVLWDVGQCPEEHYQQLRAICELLRDDEGDRASVLDKASAMMQVLDRMFRDRARQNASTGKFRDALRASGKINQALLDQLPDSVLLVGRDRKLVFANRDFCARYGCKPEECVGASLAEFFCAAGDYHLLSAYIDKAFNEGVSTAGFRLDHVVFDIKPFELDGDKAMGVMVLMRTMPATEH
ncbi:MULTISPECIES: PAS domain-containing protein [unclassified Rhizobium]|uniref:PAS domain-containing protein n=1 Tax=unclassified Rhizobium TaxID=2613769 RepID=UPI0016023473|nr:MULTISPECIES: PAS domain-containing protein [unclassified Rhizobium]MBB1250843.1 PAS domain-containing protein [Rhizobium sp. G21]MCV3764395.1 PAS domain-containing protein [Rhizobium sp. TRM95796]